MSQLVVGCVGRSPAFSLNVMQGVKSLMVTKLTILVGGVLCGSSSGGVVWLLNFWCVEGSLLWFSNRLFCGEFRLKWFIHEETLLTLWYHRNAYVVQ